jgi:hypothetical protein
MPDENVLNELENRELESLYIQLSASVQRTAITLEEYIQLQVLNGVGIPEIKQALLNDLTTGGRIFGEFRNSIKSSAVGTLNRMRDAATFAEIGVTEKYRWIAVLINTCPDCIKRHGKVKTWEQWEEVGLPRTGATVCRQHCKCMLAPADTTELEPIKRGGSE